MTISFFSNFLNHHQLPLCLELERHVGKGNFRFVACEEIPEERIKMGYEDMSKKYDFVIRPYENSQEMNKAILTAQDSDIAIIGSATHVFHDIRRKNNKITFLYSERVFKNGSWRRFIPTTALKLYRTYTCVRNKEFYVLCASAYTAKDVKLCGIRREKCFKWGYFPALSNPVWNSQRTPKLRLMWCGRMLWWKHPEHAIEVARLMKNDGIDFELIMIGNGEMEREVHRLIDLYSLNDNIRLYGFLPPKDIQQLMIGVDIYLFTSGRQEGWGVVLNEAMNNYCVVIANLNAGSTPYLITDGSNGLTYDGSISSLHKAVKALYDVDLERLAENAHTTISSIWNPVYAANNLYLMAQSLLDKRELLFQEGPCSRA